MDDNEASARRFLADVCAANKAFYFSDRGQGALKDLQQTFPHPWLYVGELLQNAVDAGARKIRLTAVPESSSLIVEHDGAVFTRSNVEGLSARGISTKGAGTVGFMGIGFKAVFQSFEYVDISSGPWRFRFCVREEVGEYGDRQRDWLGCVLPEYVGEIVDPTPGMKCRFVLHHRLDKLGPIREDVAKVLSEDLLVLALLARRGVQELEWDGRRWLLSQSEQKIDEHSTRVLLEAFDGSTGVVRQWILFSAMYQPSREAIARFLEHRQIRPKPEEREHVYSDARRERSVDVFCPLDGEGFPVPPHHGQAYALLATGVTIPIGLHVQADWLLNTSRRELMEVATNAWHQEILDRIAGLLRAYLHWVTCLPGIPDRRLAETYAVLPTWAETDGVFGSYIQNTAFRTELREALADLPFLPVRRNNGIHFAKPTEARLLPLSLRWFEDPRLLPWELFGDDIISATALGVPTLQSLGELELLLPLGANTLLPRWESGAIGRWRNGLSGTGVKEHLKLLHALASLDNDETWREAPLRCLPTASGGWIDRQKAIALPSNWDSIPEVEPPLRARLDPFIPPSDVRLEWSFDRALQRDAGAQEYVTRLNRYKLDDVLAAWWAVLPTKPAEDTCIQILDATCWVMQKQRQQPGLVRHALCDSNGQMLLVALGDAVLADPYASRARRHFFHDHHPVSDRYLQYKSGLSDADWRSFFEEASTAMKGPLRLGEIVQELSRSKLTKALPEYAVPSTKATPMTARWKNHKFSSNNFLLVDAILPDEIRAILTGEVAVTDAQAMALWLQEGRQELPNNATQRVLYVAYNSSSVFTDRTAYPASWVVMLQAVRWVYGTDGSGPYIPAQVLARIDPARPDSPVARLPEELVATLEGCGVFFGTTIPDVASIERLRREGPVSDIERLLQLVTQAIVDAKATGHRDELRVVFQSCTLASIPHVRLIDGANRFTADRLVQRGARGGDLGGWLVPIDTVAVELGEQNPHVRLMRMISSEYDVPNAPTWEQACAFLEWIWLSQPEAELVRRTLPRAYRLIAEDLNAGRQDYWEASRVHAMIYVSSRKWVSVGSDDLFLDDLGDDRLKGMVSELALATPGHLGETAEEQYRIAVLLGIRVLSSRFQFALQVRGEQLLAQHWLAALSAIVGFIQSYGREEREGEPTAAIPTFVHCERIRKSLIDKGTAMKSWDVHAAFDVARICMSEQPDDFAADLCRILLQWAGLAGRRDLDELAPTVTQLIGWIDKPEKFARRIADIQSRPIQIPSPAPTSFPESEEQSPAVTPPTVPIVEPEPQTESQPTGRSSETVGPPAGDGKEGGSKEPPPSGGYTPDNREGRLKALRKQRNQLDKQMDALLGVGPLPDDMTNVESDDDDGGPGEFASDLQYRAAAVEHERIEGRYAEAKDANQPGYDIDSFDRPLDDPERLLLRRIEVKGHGCPWEEDDTVELSNRQFLDALSKKSEGERIAEDFDYWLYVVERPEEGGLRVLPIRNPARRAAKFEFRGGTWRNFAQEPSV